ncbi:MAG: agarase [Pseudolabrys sp.]|jgi:agarase
MSAQVPKTRWGGIADGCFQPRGYFRIVERDGVFWLIDPDGGRFLSKGVNSVQFEQDRIRNTTRIPYAEACQRKYGSKHAWRAAAAARLASWGFNTLGSWSDDAVANAGPAPLALTINLDLGMSFAWAKNDATGGSPDQDFPDVFNPDFDRHVCDRARDLCAKRSDDQSLLGWFIDNELRWGPDWRGPDEVLMLFLALRPATPGRTAALAWLRQRYPDFTAFNSTWRTPAQSWDTLNALSRIDSPYPRSPIYQRNAREEHAANRVNQARAAFIADCDAFAALVAERYFKLTCAAIRAADPHHLVLGCRFAYVPSPGVTKAAARHTDVISLNCYDSDAGPVIDSYVATGKPCLISEFSFRGADSGLPNTNGAGPLVATQAERAAAFRHYVTAALQRPTLVGYHWFEHADQPAEGRFDGENSNFGTVKIDDLVYEDLVHAMTLSNGEAEALHAAVVLGA